MKSGDNTTRLVGYLLGTLPESERREIEEEYLSDAALHEELLAIETELVDAHVRGELSADESRYLTSHLDRQDASQRFLFARALNARTKVLSSIPKAELPRLRIWSFGFERWPRLRFLATALAAMLLVVGVMQILHYTRLSKSDMQSRERPVAPTSVRHAPVFALVLNPMQRSAGGQNVLVLPHEESTIRLELVLDERVDYPSYLAIVKSVTRSRSETFNNLIPVKAVSGKRELIVELSSATLNADDYAVSVYGVRNGATTTIAGYSLRVTAQ